MSWSDRRGTTDFGTGFPDDEQLRAVLAGLLERPLLRIVGRTANVYSSTLPSEILDVRDDAGYEGALFAKYYPQACRTDYGRPLRGDVEAAVCEHMLPATGLPHAKFAGSQLVDASLWLFTERVAGHRLSKSENSAEALAAAARWIGTFHAVFADGGARARFPFLPVCDARSLVGLVDRARETNSHLVGTRWFDHTAAAFRGSIDSLVTLPATVLHGEYYPDNILVRNGTIVPVDWETAVIGPGVLDLAMLTDDWPAPTIRQAEAAYRYARHGDAEVPEWRAAVRLARVAIGFKWLARYRLPAGHPFLERLFRNAREAALA